MKLSTLIIINYKSCKQVAINLFDEAPTVLIGKNDCGKSTLQNAIGLLLSDKPKHPTISDFSNTRCTELEYGIPFLALGLPLLEYKKEDCVIIGQFAIDQTLFEEERTNDYSDQLLLTRDTPFLPPYSEVGEHLYLARRFSPSGASDTYILCKEVISADYKDAWTCSEADLKRKTKALDINDVDIVNENNKGNLSKYERVKAIHKKLTCSDEWTQYKQKPLDKSIFPEFRYLDWRASLEDINSLATDNLKLTIDEHFSAVKEQVEALVADLENKLSAELRTTFLTDIQEIVASISNIKAKITSPEVGARISGIFLEKDFSDGDIHLDAQGEGIKRQIWFALIQYAARQVTAKKSKQNFIWAFDEPETHLYPIAQRHLYDILKKASSGNIQVVISTHSTLFVDRALLSHISKVSLHEGYTAHSRCTSIDDVFTSLGLRNSDFLFYDRFLVVEGITEKYLIPGLYQKYTGRTLQEDNIQLIVLGGTGNWAVSKATLESALHDFGKTEDQIIWVFDQDFYSKLPALYKTANVFFVGRQDMEDSISSEVWVKVIAEASAEKAQLMENKKLSTLLESTVVMTLEEVDSFKDNITTSTKAGNGDKFAGKLGKYVRKRLEELSGEDVKYSILPDKGEASATILLKYISDISQADPAIKLAFDQLKVIDVVPELKATAEALLSELSPMGMTITAEGVINDTFSLGIPLTSGE